MKNYLGKETPEANDLARQESDHRDAQLLRALAVGDLKALEPLYIRFRPLVMTALRRHGGARPEELEDLCHDVFLALQDSAAGFRATSSVRAFIVGIAIRKGWKLRFRAGLHRRLVERLLGRPEPASSPHGALEAADQTQRLLSQLPEPQRTVLLLHQVEHLSGGRNRCGAQHLGQHRVDEASPRTRSAPRARGGDMSTSNLCAQLDAYLDATLPALQRSAFEAHLSSCATCAPRGAAWHKTARRLEQWAAPFAAEPSAELLRTLRLRSAAQFERPARARWVSVVAVAAAVVAVFAGASVALRYQARRSLSHDGEWAVKLHEGATSMPGDGLIELGSNAGPREVDIGPDRIVVARASKLDLLEKRTSRTVLRLARGTVKSHIEPGHAGRQFIIESAPFRVTVVGTVFETRRTESALQVATEIGMVLVERLTSDGRPLESKLVAPGETVDWADSAPDAGHESDPTDAGPETTQAPMLLARPHRAPSAKELSGWRKRAARGQCEQVLRETEKALAGAPNHVGSLRVQADCERKLGHVDLALAAYRKVIRLSSGAEAGEAMLIAASLLQDERGDHEAVLELTQKVGAMRSLPPEVAGALRVRRANALRLTGHLAESRAELDLVIKRYPGTPRAADAQRSPSRIPP